MKKKIADWDEDVGYHANIAEMNGQVNGGARAAPSSGPSQLLLTLSMPWSPCPVLTFESMFHQYQ